MEENNAVFSESGKDIVTSALDQFFDQLIGLKMRVDGRDYFLVEKLGVGGQAVVYAARREDETEANYAVKLLLRRSRTNIERCFRESNIGSLYHPNLVHALGVAEIQKGSLGILFERVYGRPLNDYLGSGPEELSRILQWGEQLADVLLFIHEKGFVHRDIKPSNILIADADGSVKLTDFGFCFDMNDDQSLSRVGAAGTLPYMSPEHGAAVSPQSDYYSLGIVLHEAVYGNRIHDVSEIDRSNPGFATMIECCMQPNKRDRYPVGTKLKEDLQALINNEAPQHAEKLLTWKKRRFAFRVIGAMIFAVFIAIVFWQHTTSNDSYNHSKQLLSPLSGVGHEMLLTSNETEKLNFCTQELSELETRLIGATAKIVEQLKTVDGILDSARQAEAISRKKVDETKAGVNSITSRIEEAKNGDREASRKVETAATSINDAVQKNAQAAKEQHDSIEKSLAYVRTSQTQAHEIADRFASSFKKIEDIRETVRTITNRIGKDFSGTAPHALVQFKEQDERTQMILANQKADMDGTLSEIVEKVKAIEAVKSATEVHENATMTAAGSAAAELAKIKEAAKRPVLLLKKLKAINLEDAFNDEIFMWVNDKKILDKAKFPRAGHEHSINQEFAYVEKGWTIRMEEYDFDGNDVFSSRTLLPNATSEKSLRMEYRFKIPLISSSADYDLYYEITLK